MSGSTIGGFAGAIVGSFFGMPQLGFMVGSMIGGYIDPDVIKQEGPRLNDASQQTSRDGIPIPIIYGTAPTAGNIIWRTPLVENIITDRERQGKGGPVTETTTYQYTRSYAVGICEGPITGLLIVKRNGTIVYDARTDAELTALGYTAQDIQSARAASGQFMLNAVLYLGDEDQLPDSVIEAHEGVGNVSAYRGLAYIRFENDDLTELRGAIPQFEFVVCGDGTAYDGLPEDEDGLLFWYPLDDAIAGGTAREVVAGWDGLYANNSDPDTGIQTVTAGPQICLESSSSVFISGFGGYMLAAAPGMDGRSEWSVSCWARPEAYQGANGGGSTLKWIAGYATDFISGHANWRLDLRYPSTPASDKNLRPGCAYSFGGVSTADVRSSELLTLTHTGFFVMTYKDNPAYGTARGDLKFYFNGALIGEDNDVGRPDPAGANIVVGGGYDYASSYQFIGYISSLKGYDYALTAEQVAAKYIAPVEDYWELPGSPGVYVDRFGNIVNAVGGTIDRNPVTVASIVADICDREGLASEQIDVSDLVTDTVVGYRIATEGGGDSFISPLLAYTFADAGEWDGKLRFIKRGGTASFALTIDDLAERDGDAIEQERAQEAELLRKVTVGYIDPAATYTATTQTWERRSGTVQAKGEASSEFPVVSDADAMAQVAEKRGKVAWSEPDKFKFSLPYRKTALTPTDIGTLTDSAGVTHRIRIMQADDDSGVRLIEATKDRQATYTSAASGVTPSVPTTPPPTVRGPTILRAMNLPFLQESQQTPGIYVAVTGLLPGWVGADLYISIDGAPEQYVGRFTNRATIGFITSSITATSSPITVSLYDNRTLDTATDAEIDANQNGWVILSNDVPEIGQSQTVTDLGSSTYELTDTERGMLGTEALGHAAEDPFVLLDSAIYFVPVDARYAGATLTLRAVTVGTSTEDNATDTLVYDPPTYVIDGNGTDADGTDGPDPSTGGAGTPGSPTARTIGATVSTPTLTTGEAAAAANSAAINAAFAGLPVGGGIVRLPAGTYYIDTSDPITPATNSRLDLDTNGTTLQAAGSDTTTAPSVHRDIIRIDGVHDVEIVGGHLIGYRDYWAANGGVSVYGVSEWAHGIYTTGSSYNITIYDCTLEKFVGDGISIGRSTHDIHINNVLSTRNRRQGISTGGDDILIDYCECSYIGVGDGTSPRAGIDIEVDEPASNSAINVTVDNCYLHHNAGPGLIAYKSCDNLTITNNRMEYNTKGVYAVDSDTVDLHNNTIKWNKYEGVHLTGTSTGWDIDGTDFFSNKTATYGTYTTGSTTSVTGTSSVTAKHITIASTATGNTVGTNTYGPV